MGKRVLSHFFLIVALSQSVDRAFGAETNDYCHILIVIRSCTKKPNTRKALLERKFRDKKLRKLTKGCYPKQK